MNTRPAIRVPWLYRAATWQIAVFSLVSGLVIFAVAFGIETWLLKRGSPPASMVFSSDLVAGTLTAILQFSTIQYGRRRRKLIMERVELIGELNHHVRNALESISSAAVLGGTNQEHLSIIRESVERITWALNDIRGKFDA